MFAEVERIFVHHGKYRALAHFLALTLIQLFYVVI
jgi:hypothetical protein